MISSVRIAALVAFLQFAWMLGKLLSLLNALKVVIYNVIQIAVFWDVRRVVEYMFTDVSENLSTSKSA